MDKVAFAIARPRRGTAKHKKWVKSFRTGHKPTTISGWLFWIFFPATCFEWVLAGYMYAEKYPIESKASAEEVK